MLVVKLEPLVKRKDPGLPDVVLSNLACQGVIMRSVPLTRPVVAATIANLRLPTSEINEREQPASITKSSPISPAMLMVVVPELALTIVTAALFTNFICAQVMVPFASTSTVPVAGVLPPTLVPSNTSISEAPEEEGRDVPEPFSEVFQLLPVVILVVGVVPPTQ